MIVPPKLIMTNDFEALVKIEEMLIRAYGTGKLGQCGSNPTFTYYITPNKNNPYAMLIEIKNGKNKRNKSR